MLETFIMPLMPDTLRILLWCAAIGGAGYGIVWALAHYAPGQVEIVKPLSRDRLHPIEN